MTWRRTVEAETDKHQQIWGKLQKTAEYRQMWKFFVTTRVFSKSKMDP